LLVFGVLAWGSPAFALGWPDTIQGLAKEKSKAAACVALLKSAGDKKAITEGQLVYIDAKAMSDGVIAGLKTLVVQRGKPSDLPKLAESLDTSAERRRGGRGRQGPGRRYRKGGDRADRRSAQVFGRRDLRRLEGHAEDRTGGTSRRIAERGLAGFLTRRRADRGNVRMTIRCRKSEDKLS
jgi:hypothetical protein